MFVCVCVWSLQEVMLSELTHALRVCLDLIHTSKPGPTDWSRLFEPFKFFHQYKSYPPKDYWCGYLLVSSPALSSRTHRAPDFLAHLPHTRSH